MSEACEPIETLPVSPRQHTQRVVSMSREVEEMRRSFEEKLRTFSQAQNQFEQEKKVAMEELKGQHRQEVQELLRSHQSQNANYSKDQEKLGQLHKAEVAHPVVPSILSKLKHGNTAAACSVTCERLRHVEILLDIYTLPQCRTMEAAEPTGEYTVA